MKIFPNTRWALVAVCFLLFPLVASAGTSDLDKRWTTVGSAGTLDEKSEDKVFFERAVVQKGQTLDVEKATVRRQVESHGEGAESTDSAVIRYNVTAVDGLFGVQGVNMNIRFLADGVGSRVQAELIQVNLASGAETTLLTFDSDNAFPVNGYQLSFACNGRAAFDFVENAYYIEATLTTSSFVVESAAGIKAIQLEATPCP